jgi:Protein of Unknown function (DUF2604)
VVPPRKIEVFEMVHNLEKLVVVVNGVSYDVKANVEAPVLVVIEKALDESGNQGQPPQNWELRDAAGHVLDPQKKLEDYHLPDGTKLFLSLKAGVGGCV